MFAGFLGDQGIKRGALVGLAVAPDGTAAVVTAPRDEVPAGVVTSPDDETPAWRLGTIADVAAADKELHPRWVTWSQETAQRLVADGVRIATCWDVAAAHRMLFGGFRADPAWAWAHLRDLPLSAVPAAAPEREASEPLDLFSFGAADDGDPGSASPGSIGTGSIGTGSGTAGGGPDDPVGPDGQLRPEWARGGWANTPERLITWARLALRAAYLQRDASARVTPDPPSGRSRAWPGGQMGARGTLAPPTEGGQPPSAPRRTAMWGRSESTAELLCAELAADGLPVDLSAAENLLASIVGPRPRDEREAAAVRATRDERVLRHAPGGSGADLRSTVQVRALLSAAGLDLPDTRAWRLEPFKETFPLVAALLEWRKAERIATTYGYSWLDAHLGDDGRLRGSWTGSDGAAGRMTASAGLHNMPAVLRKAVLAEPGHLFVRADLGQIEPRVLAAVSGDRALARATAEDDLYLPVASALGVDRPTAKVAMIAAMYGQTTGHGGEAAKQMRQAYPVAMGYLDQGDRLAREGQDLRTYGGRLVRMSGGGTSAQVAARGRYGRNALIQGAAAELFKMWAVTVRSRGLRLGMSIVLCLHDELLIHVPADQAREAARLTGDCLAETARWWAPDGDVRFIADISVIRCWADAKA
ncbi:MAG TPA: DNA polymerase [Trebonia sp.]